MAYISAHLHLSPDPADDVEVTHDGHGFWLRLKGESGSGVQCLASARQLHALACAIENGVWACEKALREAETAALDFPEVPA